MGEKCSEKFRLEFDFQVILETWDRRLYFPSEGRRAEEFFALKNPTAWAGFEPAKLGTKCQHFTSRPKPLTNLKLINNVSHIIKMKQKLVATLNASHLLHQVIFQHNSERSSCVRPPCHVFQNPVTAEMRFCPLQRFTKSQFHVRIIAELG